MPGKKGHRALGWAAQMLGKRYRAAERTEEPENQTETAERQGPTRRSPAV